MGSAVGKAWVRLDSLAKVTGEASFSDDISLPGLLYGKVLGSPYAHARIKAVDLEKARQVPGVRAVVTGKDFPYLHGECLINIPFLAIDKVRYVGEPVVAVAAEDSSAAERALRLVKVEYEELPSVLDAEEALRPEAPLLHEGLGQYQTISAISPVPNTNICHRFNLTFGNVQEGFAQSDHIFEDRFTSSQVQHSAIEPHTCIAQVDTAGRITIWGQNDSPHRARKEISQALSIPQGKIRVITGYVGGNFGGKGGLKPEAIAIALAHKTGGRPVKVAFSREEVFMATITRVGCIAYLKTGVRDDGTILSRDVRLIWDIGAYAEKGPTISLHGGSLAAGPYDIPNVHVESFSVFTNKPMAGAMRGYGLPQVAFAYESQMDIIANKLGIDPLALRQKNAVTEGSKSVTGQRLYYVGLDQCLAQVGKSLDAEKGVMLQDDCSLGDDRWVRGKGVACIYKAVKTPTVSAAYVKIDEDGSVSLVTSTVEVGQGSHTVMAQIVADVLGLHENRVTVSFADTDVTPYDTSTTSSRSTFHMGNAARLAAEDARAQLLALASPILGGEAATLELREGAIVAPSGKSISIAQLLKTTFGPGAGAAVLGRGVFTPRNVPGLEDLGELKLEAFSVFSVFHSYATQGAEVAVNLDTGEVRVLRLVAAHDVGKAINPENCRQQIQGALAMGRGYALSEEYRWDEGRMLNPSFLNYAVPTSLECPIVDVFLVEKANPEGPFGAKGLGEMALAPTAAAISNAIFDACGIRIFDLPLTPPNVLEALRAKNKG